MRRETRDLFYSIVPRENYLDFSVGETNLILSAPHGGGMRPITIPKRKWGNTKMDTYTRRITKRLIELFDYKPYYVIADIHRSRVDLNRDLEEATQGNERVENIWRQWHRILSLYTNGISELYGEGLHIDIHSHSTSNMFHVGYGLSDKSYISLFNGSKYKDKSTLEHVIKKSKLRDAIFGMDSIGDVITEHGYKVFEPPMDGNYYNGGYNIETYGAKVENKIASIQIEIPIRVAKIDFSGVCIAVFSAIQRFKKYHIDKTL